MNLEVKIEIRSIVKKITSQLADGNTHNFTVFVQGLNGNQIEHFVKQVVFYLPFNSSNSQQVRTKPPYLISGSAHASFRLPIDIFLHASEAHNKVRYSYYVYLPDKLVENAVNVKTLTFLNTPQDFRERLLLGGAEVVKQSSSEAVATHVKSEPVEIIENQNESLGNDANAEFKVTANKEAANTENTSKKNVENLECKTEPIEGADIQNEVHNELPSTCVQGKDIPEQDGSLAIQDVYSLDELMTENEILKKENETLYNKFSKQEGVIATYVEKLPVLQNDFSAVSTELDQLQQKAEANETEISSLKSTIQTLISEILPQSNKVDKVKRQRKRPKKPAVASSSSVSESFPDMTSISLQNEPYTNNSHNVQTKEKGMVMNECTIYHTSFEFPTLSADSNIMEDACKNQLKSSCNTSENKAAFSSFSYLNDNASACDTAQVIPENRKRKRRAKKHLCSVKQKIMCSVPRAALLNNYDSVKHSAIDEQVSLPVESSLDTIAIGDKTSSPIPVQIKNTAPENCSALNSVDRNSCFTAKADRSQSVADRIRASPYCQRGLRNKGFKKRKRKSKSSIGSICEGIDDRLISETEQNYYVNLLTELLINPKKFRSISILIFRVIEHLQNTTKNYLQAFSEDRANCIFLPSSESCIVSTLFEIEKKSNTYSELKLIKNILDTIHHLLMAAKNENIYGCASLCRVFTEICKRKGDLMKPLSLCVEMLKKKLFFAPYLIASIAGVWKEPFMLPSDQSEEALILLGSVSLGAGKKTKKRNDSTWFCSAVLILENFGFPSLPDVNVAIDFLKDKIISNCTQNSYEKSWMVTSSFVILAACQPLKWTKKHLIDEYIIPNLSRFATEEPNEKAFALFCDLCVDVYSLGHNMPYEILLKHYRQAPNEGSNFVQEWVAASLVKYSILNGKRMGRELTDWLEKNQEKLSVQKLKEFLLRRKMYYKGLKTIGDIVIT